MDPLLKHARTHLREIVSTIREFVECESPSDDPRAIERFVDLLVLRAGAERVRKFPGGHVRLNFKLPGRRKTGRILALGHSDTVWPLGTLREMPVREYRGRLW